MRAFERGRSLASTHGLVPPADLAGLTPFVTSDRASSTSNNRILRFSDLEGDTRDGSARLKNELDVNGHGLTFTYDVGEVPYMGVLTLKSITAYRDLSLTENQDLDGSDVHVRDSHRLSPIPPHLDAYLI